jgi:hypothetical protein
MLIQRTGPRRYLLLLVVFVLTLTGPAGCGAKKYPVEGKVVWADGTAAKELAGGMVIFESTQAPLSARGEVREDGSFRLTTEVPDDGVPPGEYRVLVSQSRPEPDGITRPPPPPMDPRFEDFKTSGLTYTVQPGKNEAVLKVERAKRKRAR